MRKRIVKLWTTSAILATLVVIIAVSPPSKAANILLALFLLTLSAWLFDVGAGLYATYRESMPKKVKAWIR